MNCLQNLPRPSSVLSSGSFRIQSVIKPCFVNSMTNHNEKRVMYVATTTAGFRRGCMVKATPGSTSSINMEDAKESEEEKSDVYSSNMTEAMGAVLTYRHELGMNYDFISPDLIVGSCLQTPADVDKLRSIGVKTIYCLQQDSDLEYFSVDISAIREYASTFDDIQHLRAEIRDFDAFDLRLRLPYVVSKLHKAVKRNGGITYIHCTAGLGRAPATALAYMFWVQGYKLKNAVTFLQSKRPCFPKVDAIKSATADIVTHSSLYFLIHRLYALWINMDNSEAIMLTGLKRKAVTLTWKGDESSTVEISGLDIGWGQKVPLKYDANQGLWILHRNLPEGRYEYKYIVNGEWVTNKHELLTPIDKDYNVNNYVEVIDNDPESVSTALWERLGSDDFDLTTNEREIIMKFLDECPDEE